MIDHNFDPIAQKFVNNIYGSYKGKIRKEIIWQELLDCIQRLNKPVLRVLDAGGGFGFFSQKLAGLGHQVTLCDISGELLTVAKTQLKGKVYEQNVQVIHCSIQALNEHVEGKFDLILNHAVLEWLADPEQTLYSLLNWLKDDGLVSLMFYNKEAQRFFNLISGNLNFVELGMPRKKVVRLSPTNPLFEGEVKTWLKSANMSILQKTGVRVLHDYMKSPKTSETNFEQLLMMEKTYCQLEPYASLGRYTHLTIAKNSPSK
ncbi:methyltransferase domain-containing protein [Psychromonas sp. RZ22]|uniref:methyltransferase domain-containing protein n=1 Tax=Psychromonas algarum TaxID=2555643 RepID=UPI0010674578|nr:methyltransferase domain-containing protein [Psychromonas sp. RZ22]TEW56167.1 methyltransferase domain-containing protein [Psychromonas sp. RZ22]